MCGTADHRAATARPRTANDRSFLARRARIDPKAPVAIFSTSDRTTLKVELRRRCRESHGWRQRTFAGGSHRAGPSPGGTTADVYEVHRPCFDSEAHKQGGERSSALNPARNDGLRQNCLPDACHSMCGSQELSSPSRACRNAVKCCIGLNPLARPKAL